MPDLTTLYKLPSPQLLVGSADGPDAVRQLALRVEREMPQLRSQANYYQDIGLLVGANQQGVAYHVDVAVTCIGWMTLDAGLDMQTSDGTAAGGAVAGFMSIRHYGIIDRQVRWHNHGLSPWWSVNGSATIPLVSGATTVSVDILCSSDSGSGQSIRAMTANLGVCQYGAPASG